MINSFEILGNFYSTLLLSVARTSNHSKRYYLYRCLFFLHFAINLEPFLPYLIQIRAHLPQASLYSVRNARLIALIASDMRCMIQCLLWIMNIFLHI